MNKKRSRIMNSVGVDDDDDNTDDDGNALREIRQFFMNKANQ